MMEALEHTISIVKKKRLIDSAESHNKKTSLDET
jgi:hypothetical protein